MFFHHFLCDRKTAKRRPGEEERESDSVLMKFFSFSFASSSIQKDKRLISVYSLLFFYAPFSDSLSLSPFLSFSSSHLQNHILNDIFSLILLDSFLYFDSGHQPQRHKKLRLSEVSHEIFFAFCFWVSYDFFLLFFSTFFLASHSQDIQFKFSWHWYTQWQCVPVQCAMPYVLVWSTRKVQDIQIFSNILNCLYFIFNFTKLHIDCT